LIHFDLNLPSVSSLSLGCARLCLACGKDALTIPHRHPRIFQDSSSAAISHAFQLPPALDALVASIVDVGGFVGPALIGILKGGSGGYSTGSYCWAVPPVWRPC